MLNVQNGVIIFVIKLLSLPASVFLLFAGALPPEKLSAAYLPSDDQAIILIGIMAAVEYINSDGCYRSLHNQAERFLSL